MIVQSIFARDNEAAIFELEIVEKIINLKSSWRTSPDDYDIIAAAALRKGNDVSFFVSPDPGGESSFLKTLLIQNGIEDVTIAKEFKPIAALATLASLQGKGNFDPGSYEGWPRICAELKRIEQSQSVNLMALLQGILEANAIACRDNGPPMFSFDVQDQRRRQQLGRLYGIL